MYLFLHLNKLPQNIPSRGNQTRTLGTCHTIFCLIARVISRMQEYLCKI